MRLVRVLVATLTAALLGTGLLAASPATADDRPKRVIEVDWTQKDWRTFKLVGTVENHANGKVLIQKKQCGTCKWKTVNKVRTNDRSKFRTKIYGPRTKGKWSWRVRVNAQDGYARSYSEKIATYLD